jgi:hypothetical protein
LYACRSAEDLLCDEGPFFAPEYYAQQSNEVGIPVSSQPNKKAQIADRYAQAQENCPKVEQYVVRYRMLEQVTQES